VCYIWSVGTERHRDPTEKGARFAREHGPLDVPIKSGLKHKILLRGIRLAKRENMCLIGAWHASGGIAEEHER